jgi:hypothetical protein
MASWLGLFLRQAIGLGGRQAFDLAEAHAVGAFAGCASAELAGGDGWFAQEKDGFTEALRHAEGIRRGFAAGELGCEAGVNAGTVNGRQKIGSDSGLGLAGAGRYDQNAQNCDGGF